MQTIRFLTYTSLIFLALQIFHTSIPSVIYQFIHHTHLNVTNLLGKSDASVGSRKHFNMNMSYPKVKPYRTVRERFSVTIVDFYVYLRCLCRPTNIGGLSPRIIAIFTNWTACGDRIIIVLSCSLQREFPYNIYILSNIVNNNNNNNAH